MKVTITSPSKGGVVSGWGTTFVLEDGAEIRDVIKATVAYEPDGVVVCTMHLAVNPGSIQANAMLALPSLEEAAKYYGMELVPKAEG